MRPKACLGLASEPGTESSPTDDPQIESSAAPPAASEEVPPSPASPSKRPRAPKTPKDGTAEKKQRAPKKEKAEETSPAKKPRTAKVATPQDGLKKAFAKTVKTVKPEGAVSGDASATPDVPPAPEPRAVLSDVLAAKLESYTQRLPTLLASPPTADIGALLLAHPETIEQLKTFHATVTLETFVTDDGYADVTKAVVAKLAHDSPLPLTPLAAQISQTLFPDHLDAGTKLIINCLTKVTDRKAYGLKPPLGIKYDDDTKDYFWRWNMSPVYQPTDLKPAFEKNRRAWEKRRTYIELLNKFLEMAEGSKVDETKMNQIAEKIDKIEREAEILREREKQKLEAVEKATAKQVELARKAEEKAEQQKALEMKKQKEAEAKEEKQKEREAEKLRKDEEKKKKEVAELRKTPALTKFFQKQEKVAPVVIEKQHWYNEYMLAPNSVLAPLFRTPRKPDVVEHSIDQLESLPSLPFAERNRDLPPLKRRQCSKRKKFLCFYENFHPPLNTVWTKQSSYINPRNPLVREKNVDIIDYDYDTDDVGSEDEGEDLDSVGETSDDDPDRDREVKGLRADGLEEMEGFLEPEENSHPGSPRKRKEIVEPVVVGPYFEDAPSINSDHAASLHCFRIQKLSDVTVISPLNTEHVSPVRTKRPKATPKAIPNELDVASPKPSLRYVHLYTCPISV